MILLICTILCVKKWVLQLNDLVWFQSGAAETGISHSPSPGYFHWLKAKLKAIDCSETVVYSAAHDFGPKPCQLIMSKDL